MEEYLTTQQLSDRIKMTPGTIRNLVWKNVFVENIHYLKPTPRKVLFVWSSIEQWLHGDRAAGGRSAREEEKEQSLIRI